MKVSSHQDSAGEFCCVGSLFSMKLLGSVSKTIKLLSILIPSYFGPTLHSKKGGGSSGPLPYYLINTWLYKRQILQGIRDTLQGLRKYKVCKKYFVWLPWQLFDNMMLFAKNYQNDYEKLVIFKCSQKPQIRRC